MIVVMIREGRGLPLVTVQVVENIIFQENKYCWSGLVESLIRCRRIIMLIQFAWGSANPRCWTLQLIGCGEI